MSLSLPRSFDTLRMSKGRARGTALAKLNPLACREHPPPAPPYRRTAGAALGRGAGVATSRGAGRLGAEASIFNVSEAAGSTLPVILSRTRAGERPGARSSRTEDVSSGYPHDGWPVVGDTDAWLRVTGQILSPAPPPSSRLRMLVLSWSKGRPGVGALGSTRYQSGRPEAPRHPEPDASLRAVWREDLPNRRRESRPPTRSLVEGRSLRSASCLGYGRDDGEPLANTNSRTPPINPWTRA